MSLIPRKMLAVTLALSACAAAAQDDPQARARALFQKAAEHHQAGEFEQAIAGYQELLELLPENPGILSNLGAALVAKGQVLEGISRYREALAVDPSNAAVRLNLALALYKSEWVRAAALELERVVAQAPDNMQAVTLLADCWFRMGERQRVVEALSPLATAERNDRAMDYLLGMSLIVEGQVETGQVYIDRILRGGDSAEARILMGTTRMVAGEWEAALEDFERAAALNPELPGVHSKVGETQIAIGKVDEAVAAFRRELERNPNDFDANLLLGNLLREDFEYEEAMRLFERALAVRPGAPDVRFQIGSLQLAQGETEEARKVLEPVVEEWPDFVEAHVSLAQAYFRLKRPEDARRHQEIVRELNAKLQEKNVIRGPAAGEDGPGPGREESQ